MREARSSWRCPWRVERPDAEACTRALGVAALAIVLSACVSGVQVTPSPSPTAAAPTVSQTSPPTLVIGRPTPTSLLAGVCGSVIGGVPSDGAHMLLTMSSGGSANATYSLESQFESGGGAHPLDIDGRVAGTLAWLSGRQVPADSGAPAGAVGLREWMLRRATSCAPLAIVDATPSLFTLPQGCAFVGSPVSTADQTDWKVDCGAAADRDARGTLAPAFARGGWTSCGSGLGTALWANSRFLLVVVESSGAVGEYPTLTQRLRRADCP